MQQHEMNHTRPYLLVSLRALGGLSHLIGCVACALLWSLSLGSPVWVADQAEAQAVPGGLSGKRIETFVINPASFSMVTSAEPDIDTAEGTTTYILTSRGSVTFTPMDGPQRTISLNASDRVIERPFAGTVTVVRNR